MGTKIFQVTVGTQFKEALKDLALKIWSTTPYFVRCIKPNSIKKPKVFDNNEVATQLNCAGVFEAIRIMRDMYPSRITHDEFYKRFTTHEWRCIIAAGKNAGLFRPLPSNNFDDFEALRLSCSALCQALSLADDSFQVGRSKVFFRTGVLAQQEERLQRYIFLSASKIRARYLGWVLRRQFVKNRAVNLLKKKIFFLRTMFYFCLFRRRSCCNRPSDPRWPKASSLASATTVLRARSSLRGARPA